MAAAESIESDLEIDELDDETAEEVLRLDQEDIRRNLEEAAMDNFYNRYYQNSMRMDRLMTRIFHIVDQRIDRTDFANRGDLRRILDSRTPEIIEEYRTDCQEILQLAMEVIDVINDNRCNKNQKPYECDSFNRGREGIMKKLNGEDARNSTVIRLYYKCSNFCLEQIMAALNPTITTYNIDSSLQQQ